MADRLRRLIGNEFDIGQDMSDRLHEGIDHSFRS